jgi:hypothetical protein
MRGDFPLRLPSCKFSGQGNCERAFEEISALHSVTFFWSSMSFDRNRPGTEI